LADGAQAWTTDGAEDDDALRGLAMTCRATAWGGIFAPRAAFVGAKGALRLLQMAAACASGRAFLARPGRAGTILERLKRGERFVSTLGGARLEAGHDVFITREAGEFRRLGAEPAALPAGRPVVWDGRFELTARRDGLSVTALKGHLASLSSFEKSRLYALPAAARGALPAIVGAGPSPTCPLLAGTTQNDSEVTALALAEPRFQAACGLIQREGENTVIGEVANGAQSSYVGREAKGVFE
jgi:tRNA(Ile)-lysidine synthase